MDMELSVVYRIDLTKIEGDGDFPCPRCGTTISPDDKSESVYSILDTKVRNNSLEEVTILCKCGARVRLVGFLYS